MRLDKSRARRSTNPSSVPGSGRSGLAANLAANPPVLRGRMQIWMDPAERMWTQPAVLLGTRNASLRPPRCCYGVFPTGRKSPALILAVHAWQLASRTVNDVLRSLRGCRVESQGLPQACPSRDYWPLARRAVSVLRQEGFCRRSLRLRPRRRPTPSLRVTKDWCRSTLRPNASRALLYVAMSAIRGNA
jgi:hypothetical protein